MVTKERFCRSRVILPDSDSAAEANSKFRFFPFVVVALLIVLTSELNPPVYARAVYYRNRKMTPRTASSNATSHNCNNKT